MKHKFLSLILSLLLLSQLSILSFGKGNTIDDITQYNFQKYNVDTVQAWIDEGLSKDIGISAEWYVIALSHSGKYDFSIYEDNLLKYLQKNQVNSASTREKFALALSAIGSDNLYITDALNNSLGEQGIMSYVYGLHLLSNGYKHNTFTISDTINAILSMQLQDGGWTLRGSSADVDVTAMTIQALAPYYSQSDVKTAVDLALDALSSKQMETGEFLSYGVANPESACQVVVALSILGIDPLKDNRFIKNGNTLFDGIMRYQLDDGSFSHQLGGATNLNATVQVFYSLTSYNLFKEGKNNLFSFDANLNNENSDVLSSIAENSDENNINSSEFEDSKDSENIFSSITESSCKPDDSDNKLSFNYKTISVIAVIVISLVLSFILFMLKKRNYKNFLAIFIVSALIIFLVLSVNIQSKESYYGGEISKENITGKVLMSINCSDVNDSENKYIPSDGVILSETEFAIAEGDTAYDILIDASKKFSIQVENNGTDEMAYIVGINYLYEFQYGDLSGWIFRVNGVDSDRGCSDYVLRDGDKVEWIYTCDFGNNLN